MSLPGHALRRIDLDRLREAVTVAEVLCHFGDDLRAERGRTRCPVHDGQNPTSLSFDARRWHCFSCGAGGDVFDLVQALLHCTFPEAIAHAARLAGFSTGRLPTVDPVEVERRAKIQRRREALRRWRGQRLSEWLTLIGNLDREAQRLGAHYMARARDAHDPDGAGWRLLASLHADLETAELMAGALSPHDEEEWAQTWLAEQRHQVPTPQELWL